MIGVGFWTNNNWLFSVIGSALPRPVVAELTRSKVMYSYNYPLPVKELTRLVGNWQWLQTSGSWQPGKTSATTGCLHALELKENGTLLIWKNEELFGEGHFYSEGHKSQKILTFKYSTRNKANQKLFISFRLIGNNTLCLTEEGRFRRKQHLFLRLSGS